MIVLSQTDDSGKPIVWSKSFQTVFGVIQRKIPDNVAMGGKRLPGTFLFSGSLQVMIMRSNRSICLFFIKP